MHVVVVTAFLCSMKSVSSKENKDARLQTDTQGVPKPVPRHKLNQCELRTDLLMVCREGPGVHPDLGQLVSKWSLLCHYVVKAGELLRLPHNRETNPLPLQISLDLDCLVCWRVEVSFTPSIYY